MILKLSIVFLIVALSAFIQPIQCQQFSEFERDEILRRLQRNLEEESLRIFDGQLSPSGVGQDQSRFQSVINFEGTFEKIGLQEPNVTMMMCGDSQLVGFDYKRHDSTHYLLCFSRTNLYMQTFTVTGSGLQLSNPNVKSVDGVIKQALFYRQYDTSQLFVATHIKRGLMDRLKVFQVVNYKLEESNRGYEFKLNEQVIRIGLLHYELNKFKMVALLGNRNETIESKSNLIVMTMPNAYLLQTLRIKTTGFLFGANNTHWCAYSFQDTGFKTVPIDQMNIAKSSKETKIEIHDMKAFTVGIDHYVVVGTNQFAYIYKWDGTTFKAISKIKIKEIIKVNLITISYAREDFFIYFNQPNASDIRYFWYDINQRNFAKVLQTPKAPNLPDAFNPYYSNHFSEHNIAFELKLFNSYIYVFAYMTRLIGRTNDKTRSVETPVQEPEPYFPKKHREIESKLSALHHQVSNLETIEVISKQKADFKFNFSVTFKANVVVENVFESRDVSPPSSWVINNEHMERREVEYSLEQLRRKIVHVDELNYKVHQNILHDVVFNNEPANIIGLKEFTNTHYATEIEAASMFMQSYHNKDVRHLLNNLYRTSINHRIQGTKIFAKQAMVNGFLRAKSINEINPEAFMYGDLAQDVYSNLWYQNISSHELFMPDQLVTNVTLSKAIFINQKDDLEPIGINNPVVFNYLNVGHLQLHKLDNLPMNTFTEKVLRKNALKPQIFKVHTQMATLNILKDMDCDLLNGHNTTKVFSHLVRKNGVTHFSHPVKFNGDVHVRFLDLKGALNGINIPLDLIDKFSYQTIEGAKQFASINVEKLQTDFLNGNKIETDLIILDKDEAIPGHLCVDHLRLANDLTVHGLVDRINLTHLNERVRNSMGHHFENLTFSKPVYVNSLVVRGSANGFKIRDIYNDCIFNYSRNVVIEGTKIIPSMLKCNSIKADSINGQDLDHFVTTNSEAFLPQQIVFKQPVQFGSVKLENTFDGISVHEVLKNIAIHDSEQVIYGQKSFNVSVAVDRLFVHGLMNHIRPNSFMLYSAPQNITGHKMFSDLHVAQLESKANLQLLKTINNFNFDQLNATIIRIDRPRVVNITLHCANCSAPHIHTTYFNSNNFTYFKGNYLTKNTPQIIRGNKNFYNFQEFNEIQTQKGIYGLNLSHIQREAITIFGHNVISNPVIIRGNLQLRNSQLMADLFNDINIKEYNNKVVHNNQTQIVEIIGDIHYQKGFDLHAKMSVTKLNNHPPENLIMTTTHDHKINSKIHFSGNVITSGNLKVHSTVNGLDLTSLDRNVLKVNDQGEVNGSVNFEQSFHVKDLNVHGHVNGIPLHRQSILMDYSPLGLKNAVFNGPVNFNQNLNVLNTLNNYTKSNLHKIVFAESLQTQVINATKTFTSMIVDQLEQQKGDVSIKTVNGVNLKSFEEYAVWNKQNRSNIINVPQHFIQNVTLFGDVSVLGLVNGIDLMSEVIRLDATHQIINGTKIFEKITCNDDIDVHGTVNAFNLSHIQHNILYNTGPQQITNGVIFKAPIYLEQNSSVDLINRIKPSNLLILSGNQQVNGHIRFDGLRAPQIKSGSVNNVNLTDVSPHLLYKNSKSPQKIQGTIIVNKAQFDDNVNLKHKLNEVNLNKAVQSAHTHLNQKFDIKQVAKSIQNYTNSLYQRQVNYEYANFEITHIESLKQSSQESLDLAMIGRFIYGISTGNVVSDVLQHPHQTFKYGGYNHIAFTYLDNQARNVFRIIKLPSSFENIPPIDIYSEFLPKGWKPLVFVMENSVHILYGLQISSDCSHGISHQSQLKRFILANDYLLSNSTVQYFNEPNVLNLGHFVDEFDYHYLVFNSISSEENIKVYKRMHGDCNFEFMQAIGAQNVKTLALFKFGLPGFVEQYLTTLDDDHLTVWKQQGILGFSQSWSVSSSINDTMRPFEIRPLLLNYSRFLIYAPTCSVSMFEARFNGPFSYLQLRYDNFI